jgi:hypothetical protein
LPGGVAQRTIRPMQTLTPEIAAQFAATALGHVEREYPNKLDHVLTGDHPPLWWTRVTAYAAAASCSLLMGVV